MDGHETIMLSEKSQGERQTQNSLNHLWDLRKMKDSMIITPRDMEGPACDIKLTTKIVSTKG